MFIKVGFLINMENNK